ncbi:MAG: RHS repeat-associated core domain-containing protein [Mycobacteriales bacterium]
MAARVDVPARRSLSRLSLLAASAVLASSGLVSVAAPASAASAVSPAAASPAAPAAPAGAGGPQGGPRATEADGEIPALRTATSRTYRLKTGALQARLFDRPVNHRDGSGGWAKNDNRIGEDSANPGRVRNTANSYRLSLPKELGDGPVMVEAAGASVGFSLQDADGTATIERDTATYDDALPGVDLEYQATDSGVKETLILQAAAAPTAFVFDTSLSRGLRLAETADGGLAALDGAGVERLRFAPPHVQDASGSPGGFSTEATSLTLSGPASDPTVTLSLDPAWLADPARVFPVRLDPTYELSPAGQTYLNSGGTTTNYSGASTLRVGTDTGGKRNHALIKFDTSNVPRDIDVYRARLTADITAEDANADGITVQAKPLTRAWTASSATWNTYDGSNAWTTAGGDVGATTASATHWAGNFNIDLDLRSLATDWVTGAVVNHGVQLSSTSTTTGSSIALAKNGFSPLLTIEYVDRTGDRPYYTYSSKQLTDRSELKVNVSNGNLLLSEADVAIPAPGVEHTVGRFYNSRGTGSFTGNLPAYWTQSPGPDEFIWPVNDGAIHYGPTGSAIFWRYTDLDGTTFASAAGSGADLSYDLTTGLYTRTDRRSGEVKTFDGFGELTSVKDRNGNVMSVGFDAVTSTAGRKLTLAHTGCNGLLSGMTDDASRSWSYGYDSWCEYLTSYTNPAGETTSYGYAGTGLLSEIVTPGGRKTLITYDGQGRALSVKQVTDTANNTGPTTTYAYSATGGGNGKTVVTDPNGNATSYFYDSAGRVIKATDALGRSRSATLNADNSVTSAVDAMSPAGTSSFGFDSDFRATDSTAPTGVKSTLRYAEAVGTVTSRVAHWQPSGSVDGNGSDTSYTYDGPGNLTETSTAAPDGAVTASYTYNGPAGTTATCGGKPGQVCTATDGNNNITRYSYNTTGDLTNIDNPAPLGDTSATYDALGRKASSTDGKGQVTRYVYDALDRITQVRLSGVTACTSTETGNGTCVAYSYDNDGNRTSQVDQTGTTSYGYDALSRQTSKALPGQSSQTLTYDATGNLTSISDPSGTTSYRYDAANQLISLAEPGGSCTTSPTSRCTTFGYNNNGLRTSTSYPTTTATTMSVTPDGSGRVKQIRAVTGSTVQSDFSYTYTSSTGGDTALTRSRTDAVAGRTTSYGYDTLNRLTSAVEKDGAGTQTAAWNYAYDNAGNRTSATIGTTQNSFGYNAANQLISRNGSTSGFSYDANGNETAAVGATTRTAGSWNNKDQLTAVTAGGTSTPFAYTGLSQNERTSRGSTSFTTSPTGLATETTDGATTSFIRDPNGTLIAMRNGDSSFYYLFDGLGSVVGLVNSSGSKVNSYSYDPYGINRAKTEQVPNPFEYTGGYLDDQTGLYKFGIRYYDPTLGRFTQLDPTGQDPHYTYARNNPCNYSDPSGASVLGFLQGCGAGAALVYQHALATSAVFGPQAGGVILAGGCVAGGLLAEGFGL